VTENVFDLAAAAAVVVAVAERKFDEVDYIEIGLGGDNDVLH
jgi:hypothetical protein